MQAWVEHEILHIGAEAEVASGLFLGRKSVQKRRIERNWRHPDLDRRLCKSRMSAEARILIRLHKIGIQVPKLRQVNLEGRTMILSKLPGHPVIDLLRENCETPDGDGWQNEMLFEIGIIVRKLHRNGVSHGDLSTNNIFWCPSNGASLLDFGLSRITEDIEHYGIDLHILHEILGASHPSIENAMQILLTGYQSIDIEGKKLIMTGGGVLPTCKQIIKRYEDIITRVRYADN